MKFILTVFFFVLMPLKAMHLAPRLASRRSTSRLIATRPIFPRSHYSGVVAPKERSPMNLVLRNIFIILCSTLAFSAYDSWNQSNKEIDESVPDPSNVINLHEYAEHFEDVEKILDVLETSKESGNFFSHTWRSECMKAIFESSLPPVLKLNIWLIAYDPNLRDKSHFRRNIYTVALHSYIQMDSEDRQFLLRDFKERRPFFEHLYKLRLADLESSLQSDCAASGLTKAEYRSLLLSADRIITDANNASPGTNSHDALLSAYRTRSFLVQASLVSSIESIRRCEQDLHELNMHLKIPLKFLIN